MRINLLISYSEEFEVERVSETIKRLPWYREHNYPDNFAKLPAGVTADTPVDGIACAVSVEYKRKDFDDVARFINDQWSTVVASFEELRQVPSIILRDSYTVLLTKYGSGGSYDAKMGVLIINISSEEKREKIVGVIVHEIIHTTIQHFIDTYQVRHWRKERLVDLLVDHFFTGLKKAQVIKEDVSMVDRAFEDLFPDLEAVAKVVGGE
jgi:hypothetical protein